MHGPSVKMSPLSTPWCRPVYTFDLWRYFNESPTHMSYFSVQSSFFQLGRMGKERQIQSPANCATIFRGKSIVAHPRPIPKETNLIPCLCQQPLIGNPMAIPESRPPACHTGDMTPMCPWIPNKDTARRMIASTLRRKRAHRLRRAGESVLEAAARGRVGRGALDEVGHRLSGTPTVHHLLRRVVRRRHQRPRHVAEVPTSRQLLCRGDTRR